MEAVRKMATPHLKIVPGGADDRCGAPTNDGTPCQRPTTGGLCWQHREEEPDGVQPPDNLNEIGRECWWYHMDRARDFGVLDEIDEPVVQ